LRLVAATSHGDLGWTIRTRSRLELGIEGW
jgi:hypothetical protein